MTKRVESLCWWLGFIAYLLLAYALYKVLKFFPRFHREYADVIYEVAWLPLGAAAWWMKNQLEDWLAAGDANE